MIGKTIQRLLRREPPSATRDDGSPLDAANVSRAVVEQSLDGILVIDADGIIRYANPAAMAMLAGSTAQVVGFHLGSPAIDQPVEMMLPNGDETLCVEVRACDITWEERPATLASLRDITRHRRVEEELRAALAEGDRLLAMADQMRLAQLSVMEDQQEAEAALRESERFLRSTLDGLSAHIALLDDRGEILLVNRAWRKFAERNGLEAAAVSEGANYLQVCDLAQGEGSEEATLFASGIRAVLQGAAESFALEYPCHAPDEERWFIGRVTPFPGEGPRRVVVAHESITERKVAEQALRESAVHFRNLADSGQALIWTSGVDKQCNYFNRPWLEFRGRTLEQELGDGWAEGVHPDDLEECMATYTEAFDRRQPFSMVYRLRRHDGVYRWIQDDGTPRYDGHGAFIGYIGHCLDVTEARTRELQQALAMQVLATLNRGNDIGRLVEDLLRLLKESTGIEAVAIRLAEGSDFPYVEAIGFPDDFLAQERFLCARTTDGEIECNDQGEPVLDCICGRVLSGEWAPGKPGFTPHGSYWACSSAAASASIDGAGRQATIQGRCFSEGYETIALIPLRSGDQTIGLLQLNDHRPDAISQQMVEFLEGLGASIGIAVARQRAAQACQESEEKYRLLAESTEAILWEYDIVTDRWTYVAPQVERILGYRPEEWTNLQFWEDHLHEDDRAWATRCCAECTARGEAHQFEYRFIAKDGDAVWLRDVVSVEMEDGRPVRLRGFMQDISMRKQAEEDRERLQAQLTQAQKMEAIGQLAGGVAHDFNNMLGVILGYADLAMRSVGEKDPLYADLDVIVKAARRSADITRQLLAFARKQTIAPVVVDLNEAVEGMLKMLRRLIGEDIDLAWMPESGLWPIKMDPSQIDQILANLCVNARDAITDVGQVTIETGNATVDEAYCATHPGATPGDYVTLVVSDDGCGMDQEVLSHLFEPFFTTKKLGEGTGLGLATVYGIVSQNGGFVHVYSEPGKGSTFRIYLPRHVSENGEEPDEKAALPRGGGETILLVEDEAALLRLAQRMLEQLGYQVIAAGTPAEAVRLADECEGTIDLLITDVVMPEMNGRELAERVQALHPTMRRLYMSGYTANAIAHRGVLDEGISFIQKPLTMESLAAKVRESLSGEAQE